MSNVPESQDGLKDLTPEDRRVGVSEEIHKTHGQALWIYLNRGQHLKLEDYPVDTSVAMIHSTPILLSEDVSLDRVRYQPAGRVREAQIIQTAVQVKKMIASWEKTTPPHTPKTKGGRGVSMGGDTNTLEI